MQTLTSKQFKQRAAHYEKNSDVSIRKAASSVTEQAGERRIRFTISTEAVDRDWDRVMLAGWDLSAYAVNPVVLFQHNPDWVIGKCVEGPVIEGGVLKATVEFLPFETPHFGAMAEGVYQNCLNGVLSTTSVGFIPHEFIYTDDAARGAHMPREDRGQDITRAELMEFSVVTIPSNREAVIERSFAPAVKSPEPHGAPVVTHDNTALLMLVEVMGRA